MSRDQPARLRNIGPVSAKWLAEIGVHSLDDLARIGVVPVYAMVRRQHADASLNLLWALEGALLDIDCRDLPQDAKSKLRQELERYTA